MKNRGFTLVELLAVIAILSIIALIVAPRVIDSMNQSKEGLSDVQVDTIEKAADNWAIVNADEIPMNGTYSLSLDRLASDNYIDSSDLYDPKDNSKICGHVDITYSGSKYKYNFVREDC